jgi:lysophospholipid acyltransferase
MMLALPKKIMPATIFFFALAYVVVSHLYRMYVDLYGWQVDFTGPQMVLTMKLSSFAWNLYDGSKYDQLTAPKEDKRLTAQMDQRKRFAIREMPSPLEYFAFQYNFSSILVGPAFEYNDYIRAVTGEAFAGKDGKPQSAPGNVLSALHRLLVGVACLVINQVGQPMFPIKGMISEEMLAKPFVLRAAYAWVSLLACRCKYYFAWKVAEGGAILAGFGYEGSDPKTGKPNWTGVSNMDIIGFETASVCITKENFHYR